MNKVKKYLIDCKQDWSFEIKNVDSGGLQELPKEDLIDDQNCSFILQYKNSSLFYVFKDCFKLKYLVFIDTSKLQASQYFVFKDSKLKDPIIAALFTIFSGSNFFDDSVFFAFIKHFLPSKKGILPDYFYSLIVNEENHISISLNCYSLFFCFFMKGSDFQKTNFKIKLDQKENTSYITSILRLYDPKENSICSAHPDRFRKALILTIYYHEVNGKFKSCLNELKKLNSDNKLNNLRQKLEKDNDNDPYIEDFLKNIVGLMEPELDIETWLNFIDVMKLILPNKYWSYFTNKYIFDSLYFLLRIDLSSQIIIKYKLINQLITKKPPLLNDFINNVVNNEDNLDCLKSIDKNVFNNYYMTFNLLSFKELLLTNQGFSDFSEFKFTNRFKYFDAFVCILKFAEMTIDDFIDSNKEDIQILADLFGKLKKEKYVDYLSGEETEFKSTFSKIFIHKFRKITTEFNEKRVYIIKDFITKEIFPSCIFYQMTELSKNDAFKALMKCFMKKENCKSFDSNVDTIINFFDNNQNNLPVKISFEQMKDYEPPNENDSENTSLDEKNSSYEHELVKVEYMKLDDLSIPNPTGKEDDESDSDGYHPKPKSHHKSNTGIHGKGIKHKTTNEDKEKAGDADTENKSENKGEKQGTDGEDKQGSKTQEDTTDTPIKDSEQENDNPEKSQEKGTADSSEQSEKDDSNEEKEAEKLSQSGGKTKRGKLNKRGGKNKRSTGKATNKGKEQAGDADTEKESENKGENQGSDGEDKQGSETQKEPIDTPKNDNEQENDNSENSQEKEAADSSEQSEKDDPNKQTEEKKAKKILQTSGRAKRGKGKRGRGAKARKPPTNKDSEQAGDSDTENESENKEDKQGSETQEEPTDTPNNDNEQENDNSENSQEKEAVDASEQSEKDESNEQTEDSQPEDTGNATTGKPKINTPRKRGKARRGRGAKIKKSPTKIDNEQAGDADTENESENKEEKQGSDGEDKQGSETQEEPTDTPNNDNEQENDNSENSQEKEEKEAKKTPPKRKRNRGRKPPKRKPARQETQEDDNEEENKGEDEN